MKIKSKIMKILKKKNVDEVIGFEENSGKQNKSHKKKNNKDDENENK